MSIGTFVDYSIKGAETILINKIFTNGIVTNFWIWLLLYCTKKGLFLFIRSG